MAKAFDGIFPIGLGTSRLPFSNQKNLEADFENAVNLALYAIGKGVNYIDTARGYSGNRAMSVVREVLRRTERNVCTTVKVMLWDGRPGDGSYYQRGLSVLKELGLEKASHFLVWALMDHKEFQRAKEEDGLYDAALQLKAEGRVEHIGASVHMSREDILEVIDSGLFEFVMISYNLLTMDMQEVLDRALERNVDIVVMNPLYGGLIPQNEALFEQARLSENETIVQAAVRAVLAHPAVKCVLSGAGNPGQLDEYLAATEDPVFGKDKLARLEKIRDRMGKKRALCSGCRYCADCPQGIPVPEIMNARNVLSLLDAAPQEAVPLFFRQLSERYGIQLKSAENPCVQCGKCERSCTQHLPVIQSVDETYRLAGSVCADRVSQRQRMEELLNRYNYQKVGLWPASDASLKILRLYREEFGELPFEVYLFDSSQSQIGQEKEGYRIHSREEAAELRVDCILITSIRFGEEIYQQNKDLEEQGIAMKKLYHEGDMDWWWC